jgi:hypothetical protein
VRSVTLRYSSLCIRPLLLLLFVLLLTSTFLKHLSPFF